MKFLHNEVTMYPSNSLTKKIVSVYTTYSLLESIMQSSPYPAIAVSDPFNYIHMHIRHIVLSDMSYDCNMRSQIHQLCGDAEYTSHVCDTVHDQLLFDLSSILNSDDDLSIIDVELTRNHDCIVTLLDTEYYHALACEYNNLKLGPQH